MIGQGEEKGSDDCKELCVFHMILFVLRQYNCDKRDIKYTNRMADYSLR